MPCRWWGSELWNGCSWLSKGWHRVGTFDQVFYKKFLYEGFQCGSNWRHLLNVMYVTLVYLGISSFLVLSLNTKLLDHILWSLALEEWEVMLHLCFWDLELAGCSLWILTRYLLYMFTCLVSFLNQMWGFNVQCQNVQ